MDKKPFLIGICGGSGSGKTSFIRKLREDFSTDDLCIISQDDYYKPRDKQKSDLNGILNFDLPRSIEKKDFFNDIQKLLDYKVVNRTEYTFNNDKANAKLLEFKPAPIIIVEGLFVFHFKKIFEMTDLKIYIHAKENLKVIRRIFRDQVERNYPIEDVLYRYQHHVLPAFEKFIEPHKEKADIVINNNHNFEIGLSVVEHFLKSKLLDYR
ncbi:MAG: uridine kinase [Saprospiraceae bacterium]|jgi:uridine kinase|nr:uridine kinase [Saprospiraceae bacterium]